MPPPQVAAVSLPRLYLLRVLYLLNVLLLGADVWPTLASHPPFDPVVGSAYSLWAALSLLSLLGLRYPIAMLPLLLFQLAYKAIWLLTLAMPLYTRGELTGRMAAFSQTMAIGALLDLVVIPWPYIVRTYVRGPGSPWSRPSP